MISSHTHVVLVGVELWGHARPLCTLAACLVQKSPIHITLLTRPRVFNRVKAEISRNFGPEDNERHALIRVIALDTTCPPTATRTEQILAERDKYCASFAVAYDRLVQEQTLICAHSGVEHRPLPFPKAVITDFVASGIMLAVRKISGNRVKNLVFCPAVAMYMFYPYAPISRGGQGDFRVKVEEEAARTEKPLSEVLDNLYHNFTGAIIRPPGLPPVHLWELDPQDCAYSTRDITGRVQLTVCDNLNVTDGLILATPEVYEPKAVAALRDWFRETRRDVWAIGPLLPPANSHHAISGEESLSANGSRINAFLDKILESHGEHSLLYISFGSMWWPSHSGTLGSFLDVVIKRKIPFIFSHGSPHANIPGDLRARLEASEVGLITPWSPQQTVLNHPASGWFLSHCGHNSVIEAITSGVPLICWPGANDQPANAIHLTENHDVAYELFEVRKGNGLKPIYRNGKVPVGTLDAVRKEAHEILEKAFGEDGARKRTNVKKLQEAFSGSWSEGGASEKDMSRLLDAISV